ncbi:hypothetical protein NDU88_002764 [Pleurodeles waltl]|uniref:Uncharacterized protein n=1 Tax=Pleurodeles waltl TaxID=8319 RepID=A0AAV7SEJ9_PLEWA|nr:hypothetical protein NDU88_002764 [Pleurodeles waltl]
MGASPVIMHTYRSIRKVRLSAIGELSIYIERYEQTETLAKTVQEGLNSPLAGRKSETPPMGREKGSDRNRRQEKPLLGEETALRARRREKPEQSRMENTLLWQVRGKSAAFASTIVILKWRRLLRRTLQNCCRTREQSAKAKPRRAAISRPR